MEKGSLFPRGGLYGRISVCFPTFLTFHSITTTLNDHSFTVDAAKTVDPKLVSTLAHPDVVLGDQGNALPGSERVYQIDYNTSKANKVFPIVYKTEKESATDMIAFFGQKGW